MTAPTATPKRDSTAPTASPCRPAPNAPPTICSATASPASAMRGTPTACAPACGSTPQRAAASPSSPLASAMRRRKAAPPTGRWRNGWGRTSSALDDVDCEAAEAGFLVAFVHVEAGAAHRLDDLVEADEVRAVAGEGEAARLDRLHRADRVALDAGHLDEPRDRVAGEAEIMLHADLGGILDLRRRAADRRRQPRRRHRAGDADLALAADLGAGDGGILLEQGPHGGGGEEEGADALVGGMGREA